MYSGVLAVCETPTGMGLRFEVIFL
jgi:hypothetical protein